MGPQGRLVDLDSCYLPDSPWQPGWKIASIWRAMSVYTIIIKGGGEAWRWAHTKSTVAIVKAARGAIKAWLLGQSTCSCVKCIAGTTHPWVDISSPWQHYEC